MCGIIGIADNNNVIFPLGALGLHHLQHRGQDSCGATLAERDKLLTVREAGLISDAWGRGAFAAMEAIKGLGIGHVRYPTVGGVIQNEQEQIAKTQPFQIEIPGIGPVAMVHNGNLVNVKGISSLLVQKKITPNSEIDSELALQLLTVFKGSLLTRIIEMCRFIKGGFAICILTPTQLIGIRDTISNRPLVLGESKSGYMFASETCALDVCDFRFVREVRPGEILIINKNQKSYESITFDAPHPLQRPCIFERAYFARPDSIIDGQSVTEFRVNLGRILAKEHPRDVDLVVGVPDSGVLAGYGYAMESGIPFHPTAIVRNHYVGRTFIAPSAADRDFKQRMKLTVNRFVVEGKKVVLIEDSLIRGVVSKDTIKKTFSAGAKEVHILMAYPPFWHPCRTGIAIKGYEELIAHGCETVADVEAKVKETTGADSVGFISLAGVYLACGKIYLGKPLMCDACVSGDYPVDISEML